MKLVFDRNLKGFARWLAKVRRLHGLADIIIPPDSYAADDYTLLEYCRKIGALLVTADKRICRGRPEYRKLVIILYLRDEKDERKRYEELATDLIKEMRNIQCQQNISKRGR